MRTSGNRGAVWAWLLCAALLLAGLAAAPAGAAGAQTLRVGMPQAEGTLMVPPGVAYQSLLEASLEEISKYNNWRYELVFAPEETLLALLEEGELDLVAGVYDRPALAERVAYPSYISGYTYAHLVSRTEDSSVRRNDFRSLQGVRIAVVSGGAQTNRVLGYLTLNNIRATILYFASMDECLARLEEGAVEMALVDSERAEGRRIINSFIEEPFYIVTAAGNTALQRAVNDAYEMIYAADPDFAVNMYNAFFDLPEDNARRITQAERAYAEALAPLRVAVVDGFAPFQYHDGDGLPHGINIDILEAIAERTGLRMEYVRAESIPVALRMMEAGQADILSGIARDDGQSVDEALVFSHAYMEINRVVLVNRYVDYPAESPVQAVVPGMEYLIDPDAGQIVYADSFFECAKMVNNGTADFTYGSTYFLEYGEGKTTLRNVQLLTLPDESDALVLGLRRPVDPAVLTILNKAIVDLAGDTTQDIVLRNTALKEERPTLAALVYGYPVLIIAALAVLAALIIIVTVAISLQRARHSRELFRTQYTDELTGVLNLPGFRRKCGRLLQMPCQYALSYVTIRHFQFINDRYGYEAGDLILRRIGALLKRDIQEDEAFCRISGGTFAVLRRYESREALLAKVKQFHALLHQITPDADPNYHVRMAEGIYIEEARGEVRDVFEMVDRANAAQQQILSSAEEDFIIYQDRFYTRILQAQEIESRMENALRNEEFLVYLQPKVDLRTMRPGGAEALVRWRDGDAIIPPGVFIPLFERNGFISQLDRYMFEKTCIAMRRWLDTGLPVVPVSINVSRVQLYAQDFVSTYVQIKDVYDIPDGLLEIEVTESVFLDNLEERLVEIIDRLHQAGFRCSIDDFGKGYSSLTMLKNIPVDTLKLDAQFFAMGLDELRDNIIIRSVVNIAKELGMTTIAEGIEHRETVAFLKSLGCEMIQGYVFSKPLDMKTYERYMRQKVQEGRDIYAPVEGDE